MRYKVKGLTVGEHDVTAYCRPNKDVKLDVSISPVKLTIEE